MAFVDTNRKVDGEEPGKLWYIAVWGFSLAVFALLGVIGARFLLSLE